MSEQPEVGICPRCGRLHHKYLICQIESPAKQQYNPGSNAGTWNFAPSPDYPGIHPLEAVKLSPGNVMKMSIGGATLFDVLNTGGHGIVTRFVGGAYLQINVPAREGESLREALTRLLEEADEHSPQG